MNRTEVKTIDDLPELPFEKVLSYLSLGDRLRSRAVSRGWYQRIKCSKVMTLCYSARPLGFTWMKSRWVTGAFAQNFISSRDSEWFFDTFGRSILSSLKRLRLRELTPNEENTTAFVKMLSSFGQLEELDIISFSVHSESSPYPGMEFELKLPVLTSIHFESVSDIKTLTLDAPRLREVRLMECWNLSLVIVHGESIRHLTEDTKCTAVKNLKNLLYLYTNCPTVDATFLSDLNQLKEIHLYRSNDVSVLFEQKQQLGRTDLKIYLFGLLLNGPDDPAIDSLSRPPFNEPIFIQLAKHSSRLAKEIPFYDSLHYSSIERVAPQAAIDLVSRFSTLYRFFVDQSIEDIESFLNILKNSHIDMLEFKCDQPQELFDRLPEYSVPQLLAIHSELPDLKFLFRLKHLMLLQLPDCSIDAELIRKLFEELPFLTCFRFKCNNQRVIIRNPEKWTHSKRFKVSVGYGKETEVPDLEAVIQFIVENEPQEERVSEESDESEESD